MVNSMQTYYIRVIVPDLINKFGCRTLTKIPRIKKIILNFGNPRMDLKDLTSALLALELITGQRGNVSVSSKANLMLKIRRGSPVGCKIILTGDSMYNFIFKLVYEVFPRLKEFNSLRVSQKLTKKSFSFSFKDLTSFKELSKQFYFFSELPPLNVTCLCHSSTKLELIYLLKSFKLPLV